MAGEKEKDQVRLLAYEKRKYSVNVVAEGEWTIEDGVVKEYPKNIVFKALIERNGRKYLVLSRLLYREIKVISKEDPTAPKYGYFYTKWTAEIIDIAEIPDEVADEMLNSIEFHKVEKSHELTIQGNTINFYQEYSGYLKYWPESMWDELAN